MLVCITILVISIITPIPNKYRQENFQNQNQGDKRVCIVGCARNIGQFIDKTMQKMRELKATFHPESRIIVAENDSTDDTKRILMDHAKEDKNITILNYDGKVSMPLRTERLAFLRNELISHVNQNYPDCDYVINADLDIITHSLDVNKVHDVLRKMENTPWDALFANSQPYYYDIWALRSSKIGCEVDCWDAVHHNPSPDANVKYVNNYTKPIPTDASPFLVDSAFGGLGIYRMKSIKGSKYDGVTRFCTLGHSDVSKCNRECCEHVAFHADMKKNGHGNLYIVPELTVNSN